MLNRLPRHTPTLAMMLADIGEPETAELARTLGVTERTVRRWRADDDAPRPVLLALFWVTRWGQSAAHCEAHNSAREAWGYVGCLKTENATLRAELARVLALADTGAANSATLMVLPMADVRPFKRP